MVNDGLKTHWSDAAKNKVLKENIKIRVGLIETFLVIPWCEIFCNELAYHLKRMIREEKIFKIPKDLPMTIAAQKSFPELGTQTMDIGSLNM